MTSPVVLPLSEIQASVAYIRRVAAAANAKWPQYRGYWDGAEWILVQIHREIKTKAGIAFCQGELALAKKDTLEGKLVWTVYSRANNINTCLGMNKAVPVQSV